MRYGFTQAVAVTSNTAGTASAVFSIAKPVAAAAPQNIGAILSISEFSLSGEATTSVVFRSIVYRASAGTPTNTAAPTALGPTVLAAAGTYGPTASSVTGTLAILNLTINGFGGIYRWPAPPGSEIVVCTASTVPCIYWQGVSGNSAVSSHFIVEEL